MVQGYDFIFTMLVKLMTNKATIDIEQNVSCLLLGTCTKQMSAAIIARLMRRKKITVRDWILF